MKFTLLEIVQDVLNEMDADFVNSINETVESQQVAQIAKTCFNEMISNRDWPHLQKLSQLEAPNNVSIPTHMMIPDGVKRVEWIKYDKRKTGETRIRQQDVNYRYPDEFLEITNERNSDNSNIQIVQDFGGTLLLIQDDKAPQYWTSFDDKWVVFDSYDSAVDNTLQKSKTQVLLIQSPTWEHTDDAFPQLPEEAYAAFMEEVKSTAFLALKQMANQKAEQKAARQNRWLSRKAWKAHGGVRYDDYGRKGRR